jgi:UDP-N-acetylmuramoyl-L-alanyl-D-glutamate--2,6-diaminopimelate ligase
MTLKNLIKQFIPNPVLSLYHLTLAFIADFIYGSPSKKLIVIGVTGTNGKSTTVNLISHILEEAGFKTALTSTVNFKVGDSDKLNTLKMTMPGRFFLQKLMKKAVNAGCKFMVIESSSEGILQHRQIGVAYDCMVFTNLTPEHIEAHGSFENYKNSKLKYFKHMENLPDKFIGGKKIPKTIIANLDDTYVDEFRKRRAEQIICFGKTKSADVVGENLVATEKGISFKLNSVDFNLQLKGIFDFYNALAAISTAKAFGIDLETSKRALEKIPGIPGRMELIDEKQNFKVLVDYAPEPESLSKLYDTVRSWRHDKIIHLLGSTGGGRDIARRKILGKIAAQNADVVIVTNEDPYDDDPQKIIDDVAEGSLGAGKHLDQTLFKILDRRQAINKALSLANENDLVIITGKGSEQKIAVKDGYIPWDDRKVVREELDKLIK